MPTRNLILMIAGLALAFALSACGSPNPQPAALTPIPTLAPGPTLTLNPAIQGAPEGSTGAAGAAGADASALGAAVYLKNCTACHGTEGQGVDAPALRNNQFIQTGDQAAIFNTIANGRSGTAMPAWLQANGGPLTSGEINNAIAYLKTLQGVAALPTLAPSEEEAPETQPPPGAPTSEPARPSNAGQPGPAASLSGDAGRGQQAFGLYCAACHGPEGVMGVPNPGSEDGSVPPLNPIDSTLVSGDPKVFAANVDVFIEHGSTPDGPNPKIVMPAFGDGKMLTDQQIADVIAYVIQLNTKK